MVMLPADPALKKPKIACEYKAEWSKPSKKGINYAFCTVCNVLTFLLLEEDNIKWSAT